MKIANKISLSFIITAVILTGIVAPIYYTITKNSLKNAIFDHLHTTAHSRAEHIKTYLREHKSKIELLADSILIETITKAIINNSDSAKFTEREELGLELEEILEAEKDVYEMFILNSKGKIIFSTNENNIGSDKSTDAYFLKGKSGVHIEDAYYSEMTKKNSIAISAPILDDETEEPLGVFVARFELTDLNRITADRTGLGRTGEIYVVNKHGYMITPSRFVKDTFLKRKVDTVSVRHCMEHKGERLSLMQEIDVFPDYRSVMVLGTHEYIPEMGWVLLAEINAREALAPLDRIRFLFFIVLFSVPIVTWLIAIFVSRAITDPIHKLHKGSEVIGTGNLDYRVGTDATDEIGQLSREFDKMTGNLKKTTTSIDKLNKEIAERKKAENALEDYSRRLEKSNKELDDFTYIVSHDLKEPLRSIDAFSKFIADDYAGKLDKRGKTYLERMRVNAGRMGNLIEDLLEISRVEKRKNPFEQVEVRELIDEVKLRLEYAIKQKNARVVIRDKLPRVFCDRVRFAEVFANLVSNAIKFNDKPNPRVEIGSSPKDDFYLFYVKDNGPGIDGQYFDKIFEIFQRLHRKEEYEGTGAGLTIAKKIIEMHKGKIWVESKIGEGATFYFTIPRKEGGQDEKGANDS